MLRVYFLQDCFRLPDPGAEDALYDWSAPRGYGGVELPPLGRSQRSAELTYTLLATSRVHFNRSWAHTVSSFKETRPRPGRQSVTLANERPIYAANCIPGRAVLKRHGCVSSYPTISFKVAAFGVKTERPVGCRVRRSFCGEGIGNELLAFEPSSIDHVAQHAGSGGQSLGGKLP